MNPILKFIRLGSNYTEILTQDYDYLWSSRSVVKNPYYNATVNGGFYGVDVWKYADDIVRPHLQKGMTA